MKRNMIGVLVLCGLLAAAPAVFAQSGGAQPAGQSSESRPLTPTASGDSGLWFVPSARVLGPKKWTISVYQVNTDDGQGFSDVNRFPVTFGFGLGRNVEVFGNWSLVTAIDRDTVPLFFTSTPAASSTGTGGGILADYPLVLQGWSGNKLGDLSLGGKFNIFGSLDKCLPVGCQSAGQTAGW